MPVTYSDRSAGPSTRRTPTKPAAANANVVDVWALTKAELKAEATKRGLATSGTKADLVWRLEE